MFGIRGWELLIILVIILLIFGPSKIPDLARAMGKAISEFRAGIKGAKNEIDEIPRDLKDVMNTEEEAKKS